MTNEAVSSIITIKASAQTVFAVLADPTSHAAIDGTGWVRESLDGQHLTEAGQVFRMAMYHDNHPNGSYEMANKVQVLDPPHAISWEPGQGCRRRRQSPVRRLGLALRPQPGQPVRDPGQALLRLVGSAALPTGAHSISTVQLRPSRKLAEPSGRDRRDIDGFQHQWHSRPPRCGGGDRGVRFAARSPYWIRSILARPVWSVCPAQAISTGALCGSQARIPRASQHRLDTQQHPFADSDSALRCFLGAYYREAEDKGET